jgi:hypothetical protein
MLFTRPMTEALRILYKTQFEVCFDGCLGVVTEEIFKCVRPRGTHSNNITCSMADNFHCCSLVTVPFEGKEIKV